MDEPKPRDDRREMWHQLDSGWTMSIELITATFVWGGIGWLVDRWLGSGPWVMVGGFLVGFATGMYLIYLRAQEQGRIEDAKRPRL